MSLFPRITFFLALFLALHGEVSYAQSGNQEIINEIRRAYERVDFALAQSRINEALQQYDTFSPGELSDIYVFAALIKYAQDNLNGAREELQRALQLNPALTLDPILVPPALTEWLDQLKAESPQEASRPESASDVRYLVLQDPRPSAAMRSMVLPGWGQLYKGEQKKGRILIGAWGATASGTVVAHVLRQRAEDRYLSATTRDDVISRYDRFDRWHRARNYVFMSAVGIWVYSYLDSLLQQPRSQTTNPQKGISSLSISPTTEGARIHVTFSF